MILDLLEKQVKMELMSLNYENVLRLSFTWYLAQCTAVVACPPINPKVPASNPHEALLKFALQSRIWIYLFNQHLGRKK